MAGGGPAGKSGTGRGDGDRVLGTHFSMTDTMCKQSGQRRLSYTGTQRNGIDATRLGCVSLGMALNPLPHSTPAPPNTELLAHTHTCMIRGRLSRHTLLSCLSVMHFQLAVTLLSLLRDTVEKAVLIVGTDTCRLFCRNVQGSHSWIQAGSGPWVLAALGAGDQLAGVSETSPCHGDSSQLAPRPTLQDALHPQDKLRVILGTNLFLSQGTFYKPTPPAPPPAKAPRPLRPSRKSAAANCPLSHLHHLQTQQSLHLSLC